MTTINLQKGLVGQWTMDDAHLDSGANQIKDSSGNGNHGDLIGGVSTGQPSPVGEAVSLDGEDDEIAYGDVLPDFDPSTDTATVVCLAKPESSISGGGKLLATGRTKSSYGIQQNNDVIEAVYRTDDNILEIAGNSDQWTFAAVIIREDDVIVSANGDYNTDSKSDLGSFDINGNELSQFDATESSLQSSSAFPESSIAYGAVWDRELSIAEWDVVRNMTARRVAQL